MIPNNIIVHCSATRKGHWYTAADINRWHIARGWKGIGYHKVVLLDGEIESGRAESEQGAHALGHNDDSLAVCYIGGMDEKNEKPKDTRTDRQRESIKLVVLGWMSKYQIPSTEVYGHYEVDSLKACPSFSMVSFRRELNNSSLGDNDHPGKNTAESLPIVWERETDKTIRILQEKIGVYSDGIIGTKTYNAIARFLISDDRNSAVDRDIQRSEEIDRIELAKCLSYIQRF